MKVSYVAFDSFGVKSSCVLVETRDVRICIDPGIAGETGSFPLPAWKKAILDVRYTRAIKRACKVADVIVLSHYHYDHHLPRIDFYRDKRLLIKDPKRNINTEQKNRAAYLLSLIKGKVKSIDIADKNRFKFGNTTVTFSRALWHGVKGSRLGKVVMTTVDDGKFRFLHSSDVDGPIVSGYVNLIVQQDPDLLVLDGATSYLLGYIMAYKNLERCVKNTIKLLERTDAKIILDHHLLRDYRYRELYYEAFKKAKEMGRVLHTAAEELGKKPMVLVGYKRYGPTRWRSWQPFTFHLLHEIERHARLVAKRKRRKRE